MIRYASSSGLLVPYSCLKAVQEYERTLEEDSVPDLIPVARVELEEREHVSRTQAPETDQ
jgi:hypothetical protein